LRTPSAAPDRRRRRRLLRLHHPVKYSKLALHVMSYFVCDHVSLGKLAGVATRTAAELVLQIVEKRSVEIDALVARTIERPHG
jgi:hypothetical protein